MLPITQIRPATFLGKGNVSELAALVSAEDIDLVFMDCVLSPVQQRNLEKTFAAKVIDRTGLILEIFGRRARTREGALQVELAHLAIKNRDWFALGPILNVNVAVLDFSVAPAKPRSRADRRLIEERMTRIEHDLEGVKRTRGYTARAAARFLILLSRSSAIRTQENPLSSIGLRRPRLSPKTCFL